MPQYFVKLVSLKVLEQEYPDSPEKKVVLAAKRHPVPGNANRVRIYLPNTTIDRISRWLDKRGLD